jgi:hypothetical protein
MAAEWEGDQRPEVREQRTERTISSDLWSLTSDLFVTKKGEGGSGERAALRGKGEERERERVRDEVSVFGGLVRECVRESVRQIVR